MSKERKLWVRARWLAYLREERCDQKDEESLTVELIECLILKEGPYKKNLLKGLMSARRDVGTALKRKIKRWKETHVSVCINLKRN